MIQLLLSDLLILSNEELYEVYVQALEERNLPIINTVRSVVADRYSLKALRQSPLDEPFSNPLVKRFFSVK